MLLLFVAFAFCLAALANTKQGAQAFLRFKQALGWVPPSEQPVSPASEKPKNRLPSGTSLANAPTFFPTPQPDLSLTPETLDTHDARDHIYANKVIRYPYHQTMAHQPMISENWIEPDKYYKSDLEYKKKLVDVQVRSC